MNYLRFLGLLIIPLLLGGCTKSEKKVQRPIYPLDPEMTRNP